mmetsp:Transcript_31629/g.81860  ORF Transcript_31629/g.81860 Transcript_31629/m.81860 type:complete len:263 (-) Transcript_31629:37-825(-)
MRSRGEDLEGRGQVAFIRREASLSGESFCVVRVGDETPNAGKGAREPSGLADHHHAVAPEEHLLEVPPALLLLGPPADARALQRLRHALHARARAGAAGRRRRHRLHLGPRHLHAHHVVLVHVAQQQVEVLVERDKEADRDAAHPARVTGDHPHPPARLADGAQHGHRRLGVHAVHDVLQWVVVPTEFELLLLPHHGSRLGALLGGDGLRGAVRALEGGGRDVLRHLRREEHARPGQAVQRLHLHWRRQAGGIQGLARVEGG